MVDEEIIDALYKASRAGVKVDVLVRGICSLKAGVPGLSENIRVRSVLGRYLEHSRVFTFENAGEPQVYIGSADMMHRNLDRRVEALVRLTSQEHIDELSEMFETAMSESTSSWWLGADGTWSRHHLDAKGTPLADLQDTLMTNISAKKRRAGAAR
jgi:polyphosphate kinase